MTRNFSFSHNVFYPSEELSTTFIKFEIAVCKLFQFGRVLNLSFGKGLAFITMFANLDVICEVCIPRTAF